MRFSSRCRQPWPLLTPFLVATLLTGCSLFEDGGEEPTPAPTTTSEAPSGGGPEAPSPAPTQPDPQGTVYDAIWTPIEPPTEPELTEAGAPLAEFLSEGEAVWRLFVVDGDSEPRLVQETGRWPSSPRWDPSDDSLTLRYLTRVEEAESFISGYERLNAKTGAAIWDFLEDVPPILSPSPDGTHFLGKDRSGRPYNRGPLYVVEPGGVTLTLDGFTAEDIREWSPDGRYFIATGYPGPVTTPQEQARDHYLIESDGDEVVFIGRSQQGSSLNTAWSPDSGRIAFTLGEDLVIFDISTRQSRTIPLGAGFQTFDWPSWSADGKYLAVEDGVVDADAGRVRLPPSSDPLRGTFEPVGDSAVSPNGSLLAWTENVFMTDCGEPRSTRVWLRDVVTGQDAVLLDCGVEIFVGVEWTGPERLLVRSANCDQCEPRYFGLKLFSFPDGSSRDLTDGREDGATYAVSPDRSRILVGGAKLRLYDSAGNVLRVIAVPAGYKVTSLSWSHDGSRFTYVVGPAEAFLP